jgi:acyl-CoA thioester hydrolase
MASDRKSVANDTLWRDGWHVASVQVMFSDLDLFGHVNNAVFFTYFEWGRTQLWFELTGTTDPRDIAFIVARAECDFRQQLGMERIEVWTRIGEMRTTSLDFLSEIHRAGSQDVVAAGRVVVVLYDWEKQSKVSISDSLRRRVTEHATGTRSHPSGSGAA